MLKMEDSMCGWHISTACEKAVAMADEHKESVGFTFNGTDATANPGDAPIEVQARWSAAMEAAAEAYRNSDEYKQREAKRKADYEAACAASMTESAVTEQEMRDATVPWPHTDVQLTEYVASLVNRKHDYGTCVYAMSMAAVAAFNYVAHKVGSSGFQASCADLDILRRTRHLDGPFLIIKAEDALYPQYSLPDKLREAMDTWKPWLAEQATKKLAESNSASPSVVAHWRQLAEAGAVAGK